MNQRQICFAVSAAILLTTTSAFAQSNPLLDPTAPAVPTPTLAEPIPAPSAAPAVAEKLTPGVIASFGNFRRQTSVDLSDDSAPGDTVSPILARVTQDGNARCTAVLSNSSKEHSFSVTFEIVGTDDRGRTPVRSSFAATISPEGSVSRTVNCRRGLNMAVVLKSGSKL